MSVNSFTVNQQAHANEQHAQACSDLIGIFKSQQIEIKSLATVGEGSSISTKVTINKF